MKAEVVTKWLAKLTRLHPASGSGQCHGKAPHKPLLLLAEAIVVTIPVSNRVRCLLTERPVHHVHFVHCLPVSIRAR